MPEPHDYFTDAKNLAIDILRRERTKTPDLIQQTAIKAVRAVKSMVDNPIDIDVEKLNLELRHLFSISVESATVLDDLTNHIPWLPSRKAQVNWRFWNRYATYLERDFGMAPDAVMQLDQDTNMILERFEAPEREAPWDRRGMVVGSVQSGKTANYTDRISLVLSKNV